MGHAGRGKSTLAAELAKKFSIPHYSTDDFFYKKKFTERNTPEQSILDIQQVYNRGEWIMEGTTSRLIKPGIERADIVFVMQFKHIIPQYYFIMKRSFLRKHETFGGMLKLLRHVTRKRYKKGYGSNLPTVKELKEIYRKEVIELNSIKEIKKYLKSLN